MYREIKRVLMLTALMGLIVTAGATEKRNAIMLKAGMYTLDSTSQTIVSVPTAFKEDAESEFAAEYEVRLNKKVGIGIELVSFTGNYTNGFTTGEADGLLLMANARRYYDMGEHAKVFFGGGIGAAGVDMSGPIEGNAGGLALQGMIGVEFPFDHFGLLAEYKYVSAKPEDDNGEKVDLSGSGLFAGIVVHF